MSLAALVGVVLAATAAAAPCRAETALVVWAWERPEDYD